MYVAELQQNTRCCCVVCSGLKPAGSLLKPMVGCQLGGPLLWVGCCSRSLFVVGYTVARRWRYCGYTVAMQWPYGGDTVAIQWQYSGHMMAVQWLYDGHAAATRWQYCSDYTAALQRRKWQYSGYAMALQWLCSGNTAENGGNIVALWWI